MICCCCNIECNHMVFMPLYGVICPDCFQDLKNDIK